jgi:hypothetical protein
MKESNHGCRQFYPPQRHSGRRETDRRIERTVRAIYTIKRLAWDGAVAKDPDDYANAIADLCRYHGKRLDDLLRKTAGGAVATGLFDDDAEAANG